TEDWQFMMDNNVLKMHASQGQKKSFLISLKLAHIYLLSLSEKYPVLLLDDIFEKLDRQRLDRMFELLKSCSLPQMLFTHTDADDMKRQLSHITEYAQLITIG